MMASPSELSLDCKPQSYSMLLKSFGAGGDHNNPTDQATNKLEEYLNRLEEERHKIDAFKRELPLCMQLLTNAMEASRQQLQSFRVNNQGARPVLEEFMPLKHSNLEGSDQKTANISDKANWMVSAQLWSPAGDANKQQSSTTLPKSEADTGFSVSSPKLALDTKQRNGGAFLPFAKERNSVPNNSNIRPLPDLALASSDREVDDKSENGLSGSRSDNSSKGGNAIVGMASTDSQAPIATTTTTTTTQTNRKARRCWSPDLHRRFVNALQMLGGSQATPKQIRELMKVDGLTNDEVKSHLQKYRLHTRRPSPSPQAVGGQAPQLVVLGGIWVPPEYATAAAAAHGGAPTIYSAHPSTQVSSHYCSPTVPPDYYPQPVAPPQALHHPALQHHHHHQLHVYKTTSHTQTHSSPESDAQRAGDRSESIEDGKSDCSSWKGESGENGGEGRKLAALRDDGEESNGSQITLKF
ncbi:myb family transcription factor EFM-like isoform X2 [Chenopodium quinoa]|uniref:myb family transcription factor EFM-like isoform X2 n=1 Tax=Chenopodium quinoa TaxID=63459 RepID=UPI000B775876|nr:myb family transcription factor EFM-like isoform X2 [Chenopodium quinoa]